MKYGTVAAIGFIILIVGMGMPATETITSESCTEGFSVGDRSYGGGCVESQTEVPNTTRGPVLFIGFLLTAGGGIMSLLDSGTSKVNSKINEKGWVDIPAENDDLQADNTTADDFGGGTTVIRVAAKTKEPETERTATSELLVETTDINEAKNHFLKHCNQEGIEVVSELRTKILNDSVSIEDGDSFRSDL